MIVTILKTATVAAIAALAMTTAAPAGPMDFYEGKWCYVSTDLTDNGKQPDGSINGATIIYRRTDKCSRDNRLTIRRDGFVEGKGPNCHLTGTEKGVGDRHLISYECDSEKGKPGAYSAGNLWLDLARSDDDTLIVTYTTREAQ